MSQRVNVVILCEDKQHAAFARRFLKKMGWTKPPRIPPLPAGRGSGEQSVRERFPVELKSYRSKRGAVGQALVVIVDGDDKGVTTRQAELDAACTASGVPVREAGERVAVFIPTWNIETWFAYLDGQEVDESKRDYPRLRRERECRRHVDALAAMCKQGTLREPAPASLVTACEEYAERLEPGV